MFSNVRFLTMEENSFAAVNTRKPTENHFIPENTLFYTESLNILSLILTHSFYQQNYSLPKGHFTTHNIRIDKQINILS